LQNRHTQVVGRTVEVNALRKDGTEIPVEIAVNLISFKGGLPAGGGESQFLCAFRDLTERNKMRSVLVQNEKLASIGLLSAGVAHEINNPLAFVANNLVVLERDGKGIMALLDMFESAKERLAQLDPDLAAKITALEEELDIAYTRDNLNRLIARTRDGVDRVTRIVHSLRGMARTDTPRHQEISIPDLVANSLEILQGRYKRSGIVVDQEHDANPRVTCVQTQISQVLLNLLVNAYQALEGFHKEGGRIMIRTRRLAGEMLLEVADNGPGIPAEHLDKIFDPFFTTKDVGEGTGLGLSITHNIVTAHGGRIEVHSELGHGARFQVYLPLKNPKERS
jgi:two-component system NtrC family sensor kinase